jgi:hypothetical protein
MAAVHRPRDDQLATVDVGSRWASHAAFVDGSTLSVMTAAGLTIVHIAARGYFHF